MALHTSPCTKPASEMHTREIEGEEVVEGAVWEAYDAEDGGVEVDVAEALELGGLAHDVAGAREAEAGGDRRHVHGRRRWVGGSGGPRNKMKGVHTLKKILPTTLEQGRTGGDEGVGRPEQLLWSGGGGLV